MAYYNRYQNYTPVAKYLQPHLIPNFCTPEESKEIITYLYNYSGTFRVIEDCRNRYMNQTKQEGLSEKQWRMIRNDMDRHKKASVVFNPIDVHVPMPITINKSDAIKHFKNKLNLQYAVFTLKVTKVVNSVPSRNGQYRKLTLEVIPNTDGTVNVCRMCGKSLTDHKSIVSGVGPYCAKRLGAGIYQTYKSDIQKFMKDFQKELAKIGTTTIEIWDGNIKEGGADLINYIDNNETKVAILPQKEVVSITTKDVEWLPSEKSFVASNKFKLTEEVNQLYKVVESNKDCYINMWNPKSGNWAKFEFLHSENHAEYYVPCDDDLKNKVQHLIIKH